MIRDTGIGLAPHMLNEVFGCFRKLLLSKSVLKGYRHRPCVSGRLGEIFGMPWMDSYQVAPQIPDQVWGMHMVLIALTGWGREDDKRRAQRAGFDHHLPKPVDPDDLDQLIG